MEFQDVIRRRRMVRHYDMGRPVPPDVVDRILRNGLRARSAGFSQGWAFLILDDAAGVARFGYGDEPPRDLRGRPRPAADVLHRGQWGQPFSVG